MDFSGIEILENSRIATFINEKIKERTSVGSEVPFFVGNLDNIYKQSLKWQEHLPRVKPFYAVKCNNTPIVLKTLSALGTGFDCASKREIEMVLSLGVTPDRIIYANAVKVPSHIRYACASGVDLMTFDCEDELLKISTCHPNAKLLLRLSVDDCSSVVKLSKHFGAKLHDVVQLLERARELHLNIIGVSFHVGSFCSSSESYKKAIEDARLVFDQANLLGFHMRLLNIGGGFIGDKEFPKTALIIREALDELFPVGSGVQVISEPGRFFVRSAFTLAMNVICKKCEAPHNADKKRLMIYTVTDGLHGSFGTLQMYPTMRKNMSLVLHRPVKPTEPKYQSVIRGPTCDGLDIITNPVWMPELRVGDWLLFHCFGAYSLVLANNFNSYEKAEIYTVVTPHIWKMLCK